MSPSGAVRAGPPAAQANRTANFNAHEYIRFIRVSARGNMVCMAQGALLSRKAERAARLRGQQNAFGMG